MPTTHRNTRPQPRANLVRPYTQKPPDIAEFVNAILFLFTMNKLLQSPLSAVSYQLFFVQGYLISWVVTMCFTVILILIVNVLFFFIDVDNK